MKPIIQILIAVLVTILVSCNEPENRQVSNIQIVYDTLTIDIKGSLGQIIKHQNNYYCFFERNNPYSSLSFKDFYILSSQGVIIQKINVPEKLNSFYYDLHVRNDSIITKEYWDGYSFYLDLKKSEWVEIGEVDDLIFEDEHYYVTHLSFGEFGSTVWFKDKNTMKEYEFSSTTPTISRIENDYFLSNSREVIKINPLKMMPCDSNHYYKMVESSDDMKYGSQYTSGGEYLFKDTVNPYDSDFYISTSFEFRDSLFHLCSDSNQTFIAIVDSGEMVSYKTVDKHMLVRRDHHAYRGNQFNRKKQLLKFESKDDLRKGVIEIEGNIVRVLDIINTDSAVILGKNKADKAFLFLTNYHLTKFESLSLTQLDSIIPTYGGYDVTPKHEMVFAGNPCLKSFKIIEDTTITLLLKYYFERNKESVKTISYEWRETWENGYDLYASKDEGFKIEEFNKKLNVIENFLQSDFGEPNRTDYRKNSTSMEWDIEEGRSIRLSWNHFEDYRRIRLRINEE